MSLDWIGLDWGMGSEGSMDESGLDPCSSSCLVSTRELNSNRFLVIGYRILR